MKNLTFIFGLMSQLIFGQETSLRWAEKIPTKGETYILGSEKDSYYSIHKKDNLFMGRNYDQNMNLKNENNISFNLEGINKYAATYFLNKNIVHLLVERQKKTGKYFLYAGFSDLNLKTSKQLKIIDEIDGIDNYDDSFDFGETKLSPDSTKVLVYHEKTVKRKDPKQLVYKVYNTDFTEIIQEGTASLPIKSQNFTTQATRIDNLGNIYVLTQITKEKSEREKGMSEYYLKLIVFSKDKTIKEFDFDYPDNDISFTDIFPSKNNTFLCTGFLSPVKGGSKKMVSAEMFFTVLDCNTLQMKESKKISVPGLYPDKIRKQEDFVPYKIKAIYEKSNGGYSIVAEQYKRVVKLYGFSYGGSPMRDIMHYFCDIACIQTDKNMNIESVSRTPKYQLNAENPSIISTFKNDNTYIIYEDLTKNIEADSDINTKKNSQMYFSGTNKNSIFLLTINPEGEPKKEIIYEYKESRIKPVIQLSKEVKSGEIILNANDQIGILKIGK